MNQSAAAPKGTVNGRDPFNGIYGIAVSPDGQYVAGANSASTFKLCRLTNGIPDASTLITNATHVGNSSLGIAFDAADNVYITGAARTIPAVRTCSRAIRWA